MQRLTCCSGRLKREPSRRISTHSDESPKDKPNVSLISRISSDSEPARDARGPVETRNPARTINITAGRLQEQVVYTGEKFVYHAKSSNIKRTIYMGEIMLMPVGLCVCV